jgi:hypothetical protein
MKRFPTPTIAVVALLAGVAIAPQPVLAASRCDKPNGMIEQRACAKAAEGADALRRFVERTRSIYGLYYFDFARSDAPAVATAAPTASTRLADVAFTKAAGATGAR